MVQHIQPCWLQQAQGVMVIMAWDVWDVWAPPAIHSPPAQLARHPQHAPHRPHARRLPPAFPCGLEQHLPPPPLAPLMPST